MACLDVKDATTANFMTIAAELNAADSKCAETIRSFFNDDDKRQKEELEIDVQTKLKKIFEYVNDTPNECKMQINWSKGLRIAREEHDEERISHFLDLSLGGNLIVKILRLEANLKYTYNKESYKSVLSEQEMYDTKDMITSVTVAPKSRLIRFQLVSDILGHEIGYDHVIDTSKENSKKLALELSKNVAEILVPRKILYDQTQIRIKHKAQGKFLTIVTRKDWPAATLGLNSQFYFVLSESPEGMRIKAVNTTVPEHDVLYSANSGTIYFDKFDKDSSKQCWTVSKANPLFNGVTVSFMNKEWNDSSLCFDDGEVGCKKNKEDEWILMI